MLKRLEGVKAEQFREIVSGDETTVVQVGQNRYIITRLPIINEVQFDIESDPSLATEIEEANRDIAEGRVYTTEEAIRILASGDFE
ncbi:MAG: hypothetical protein ACYCYO_07955 [Bacilli bacterium]